MNITVRVRLIERPGRWKLLKALVRGEYRTAWFDEGGVMGTEGVLGEKKRKRLEREVGVPIQRAWAWHPYVEFATAETPHRHGTVDRRDGTVAWNSEPVHYASCPDEDQR